MIIGLGIGIPFIHNYANLAIVQAFSPADLFANGEPGAWYDPSDIKLDWRYNLLTRSEEFDNAVWVKSNVTVTANTTATTDPLGGNTADKLVANTVNDLHILKCSVVGGIQTYSLYCKKEEFKNIRLQFAVHNGRAGFDIESGIVLSTVDVTASIVSVGSGWFRCSISTTLTTHNEVFITLLNSDGSSAVFTGDGTSGIYIWGASLTTAANADKPYQKITDGVSDYFTYQPQPVLYQDAAGTTPVTAVEQPVGLMLDKSKGLVLGPELVVNGTFDTAASWTRVGVGGTASISSGVASITNVAGSFEVIGFSQSIPVISGKTYLVTATFTKSSAAGFARVGFGPISVFSSSATSGVLSGYVTSSASSFTLSAFNPGNGSEAITVTIDNISVRELPGNHAFQTTATSRPVLSARYNLLTKTESFDDAAWVKISASALPNTHVSPNGTTTADTLSDTGGPSVFGHVYQVPVKVGSSHTAVLCILKDSIGRATRFPMIRLLYTGGAVRNFDICLDTSTGETAIGANSQTPSSYIAVLDGDYWRLTFTCSDTGNNTSHQLQIYPSVGASSSWEYSAAVQGSIVAWGASLVPANQADLPYQRVNTATDYDSDPAKFAKADSFDGVDDSLIASSGGGSTTKFFWCGAIQCKKIGAAQTLFSDTGTNTGYRVRINASNQLELSAGNGAAFTTVATAGALAIGQRAVLTAWHDGTSLKVQIDNGTVATAAFATATAGTAQFTMGKDNNAASSFFGGWIYEKVYLKDDVPTDTEITSTKQYMATAAGVIL